MVDVFSGRVLLNKDGQAVDPEEALQNKIVGLYFSASWCSLCRDFTPILSDFYSALVEETHPPASFEIVFVSSDRSPEEMVEYMHDMHGDWLALPFHDPFKHHSGFRARFVNKPQFPELGYNGKLWFIQNGKYKLSLSIPHTLRRKTVGKPVGMPWRFLDNQSELKKKYNITAIPKLVIVKQTGEVITDKGRKQIRERGLGCFRNWLEGADIFQNFCS